MERKVRERKYYLHICGVKDKHAGSKAVDDCQCILERNGYKPIIIYRENNKSDFFKKLDRYYRYLKIFFIKRNSTLVIQHPLPMPSFYLKMLSIIKEKHNVRLVYLIHDLDSLRKIRLDDIELVQKRDTMMYQNADVIISLPNLKTHAMTSYTGAVKNLFGTIPGTYKAELHFRLNERKSFCSMLVDLHECVKPTLSIMDAVWGMEGNGPTAGQNRHIGLVMASENAHALDLASCYLIDYAPNEVDTVREAIERGLVCDSAEKIDIAGEDIKPLVMKDYLKPESHFNLIKLISLPDALNARLINALASKPAMDYDICVGCGECARCCPPKAIDMSTGKPVIDTKRCIKCFCCQELCPKKAVKIKRPLLNRFMIKFLK